MENCIPIIEISEENIRLMWPALENAIAQASFIALDCELSGLGNRSKLNYPEIDQRYLNTKEIAKEYSIISFGISCFTCQSCSSFELNSDGINESVKSHDYLVQTFNVLTLCSNKYTVECAALKFLISHGFDFNKQYSHGLPYTRGEDKEFSENGGGKDDLAVKRIFRLILKHQKPIVIHNGFLDLVFLYQSFYADLPKNIEAFASDLLDMFPSGIYDTKYISEYHQNFPATYLEYVFKKLQLENDDRNKNGNWHCRIKFPPYPHIGIQGLKWHYYMEVFDENCVNSETLQSALCESYKFHGWCSKADSCSHSHNINRIVRELPHSSSSSAKKRRESKGIAMTSLAQLINLKKQKLEEACCQKKRGLKIRKRSRSHGESGDLQKMDCSCENILLENNNDNLPVVNSLVDGVGASDSISIGSDSELESNNGIKTEETPSTGDSTPVILNGNSRSLYTNNSNGICNYEQKDSKSSSRNDSINQSVTNKNRDCQGHSAGYDAFMTGFIFACDLSVLGQVRSLSVFETPKELNLHHMVGKVYLIGKGFPFLVRNSSYRGISPAHERIIKLIRDS